MSAEEQARAAVANFTSRPPCMGCSHVVLHGAGAVLCAQHPQSGFLCAACSERHLRRHDEAEERTCDTCRREVDRIHPLVATTHLAGGPLRDARGYHRTFDGVLLLVGLGTCRVCLGGSGRTVVDIPEAVLAVGWRP